MQENYSINRTLVVKWQCSGKTDLDAVAVMI